MNNFFVMFIYKILLKNNCLEIVFKVEKMAGFFNKILGKYPNCGKKIPVSGYNPKQPNNTAMPYWTHHRRIKGKKETKSSSIQYCKECYEKLKKEGMGQDYKLPEGYVPIAKCMLCGALPHPWYHLKMYLENYVPAGKRSFYMALVCDECFESLGEEEITKECQKPGFI